MALSLGSRIGAYEVLRPIGAGGMGDVYRARDTTLDRDVALKVLPAAFATDTERVARFRREAKVLAALNHPHIAQIYGYEEAAGTLALAIELVEGEDLATRIARGPLAIAEALLIARQIIDALDAAHSAGIIHRDLKPANVMIRHDGAVKVLDFGLARTHAATPTTEVSVTGTMPQGSAPSHPLSPDLPIATQAPLTHHGMLLGTVVYMAPEQARGHAVDRRTDIWAFGCVLYEMLTGRRAFDGASTTDVLAAIVSTEPDWTRLPSGTPQGVRRLIARSLQKEPAQRLRDIADAVEWLDSASAPVTIAARRPLHHVLLPTLALATGLLIGLFAAVMRGPAAPVSALPVRSSIALPPGLSVDRIALSPDGRRLVLVGVDRAGNRQLWLRVLDADAAYPLPGTEEAGFPFWSPDSQSIAFSTAPSAGLEELRVLDLASNTSRFVTSLPDGIRGGAWNADGVILLAATAGPIMKISASGGEPVPVTTLDASRFERSHRWPVFLPGGRRFLYTTRSDRRLEERVLVASLDGGAPSLVMINNAGVGYASSRHLLFRRGDGLAAQRFDPDRGELTGPVRPLIERVAYVPANGDLQFTASQTGLLAYRESLGASARRIALIDRSGNRTLTYGDQPDQRWPTLSPDDRRVAVEEDGTVRIYDVGGGSAVSLTSLDIHNSLPVWAPGGDRLLHVSIRGGQQGLYVRPVLGEGPEELWHATPLAKTPTDWSAAASVVLYEESRGRGRDVWVLPTTPPRTPRVLLNSDANERHAVLSPDGRWLAYASDESGENRVYVRSFPALAQKRQVSTANGANPMWRGDGRELYYLVADGTIMMVPIESSPRELRAGAPQPLFRVGRSAAGGPTDRFAVSRDGQRFIVRVVGQEAADSLRLIANWPALLER